MIKATLLYRIGAVLLLLFAAGHTFGFMNFKAPTAEGRAVWDAMQSVHFHVSGTDLSYGGFYIGLGLSVTVNQLFMALLSWHLGTLAKLNPGAIGFVGWAFCAVQVASLALSCIYFSVEPAILSGLLAICLGWAAWLAQRARSVATPSASEGA